MRIWSVSGRALLLLLLLLLLTLLVTQRCAPSDTYRYVTLAGRRDQARPISVQRNEAEGGDSTHTVLLLRNCRLTEMSAVSGSRPIGRSRPVRMTVRRGVHFRKPASTSASMT